jgi:hypothetical protein
MSKPARVVSREIKMAAVALATIILMATFPIIPMLVAAAAAETGIGVVAFFVAYSFWAGSCLYDAYAHNTQDVIMACVIGFIPV